MKHNWKNIKTALELAQISRTTLYRHIDNLSEQQKKAWIKKEFNENGGKPIIYLNSEFIAYIQQKRGGNKYQKTSRKNALDRDQIIEDFLREKMQEKDEEIIFLRGLIEQKEIFIQKMQGASEEREKELRERIQEAQSLINQLQRKLSGLTSKESNQEDQYQKAQRQKQQDRKEIFLFLIFVLLLALPLLLLLFYFLELI